MVTSTWVRMSANGLRDLRVFESLFSLKSLKLYETVVLMGHFSLTIKTPYLFLPAISSIDFQFMVMGWQLAVPVKSIAPVKSNSFI